MIIALLILVILYILHKKDKYKKTINDISKELISYKNKLGHDYEKDITFLNKIINERIEYAKNTVIPASLKFEKGLFKEKDKDDMIQIIVTDVIDILSTEYKELLSFYISDLDVFLVRNINTALQPFLVNSNIKKIVDVKVNNKPNKDNS